MSDIVSLYPFDQQAQDYQRAEDIQNGVGPYFQAQEFDIFRVEEGPDGHIHTEINKSWKADYRAKHHAKAREFDDVSERSGVRDREEHGWQCKVDGREYLSTAPTEVISQPSGSEIAFTTLPLVGQDIDSAADKLSVVPDSQCGDDLLEQYRRKCHSAQ